MTSGPGEVKREMGLLIERLGGLLGLRTEVRKWVLGKDACYFHEHKF